jgi:hypothetical protein
MKDNRLLRLALVAATLLIIVGIALSVGAKLLRSAPSPTADPSSSPTSAPGGTVVWQAGSPTIGKWVTATTNQCGNPIANGASFTFPLALDGTNCGRNQANPVNPDGSTFLLTNGKVYAWTWREIDGPSPGMGPDEQAESLVWQIHGYVEPHTPCTHLNFINGPDQVSSPQMWGFFTCAGLVWSGTYTPGETDSWKVVALVSAGTDGWAELWRNGALQGHWSGATFHDAPLAFWNFGIYKWRWQLLNAGGSTMTHVNQTIENMTLVQAP